MNEQLEETEQNTPEPLLGVPSRNGRSQDGPAPDTPRQSSTGVRSTYRLAKLALIAVVMVGAALASVRHYLYAMAYESTDDAFIEGPIIAISPKVPSYASRVHVDDNAHVTQGDVLIELDARDFEAQLAQARANLATAEAKHRSSEINVKVIETTSSAGVEQAEAGVQAAQQQVGEARSRFEQARAHVAAAEAEATRAEVDAKRYERLLKFRAVSRQERDTALAAHRTATANLDAAHQAQQAALENLHRSESQLSAAKARLASAKAAPSQVAYSRAEVATAAAEVAQAEAAVREAELNLSYTKIYAPETGRITRKSVEPGAYVEVGQTLFSIVPDHVWVVANFKETQLRYMRPGQPVEIHVDAYPSKMFQGHVDSVQSGTGARFSLLPPENATGNYVKVVQRVPVKILFDEPPDASYPLGPGMSVEPDVKVR